MHGMSLSDNRSGSVMDYGKRFATSGLSVAIATSFTHPMDVIKVQQQMELMGTTGKPSSMFAAGSNLVRNAGVKALYRGFEPAVVRSLTYGCLRLGLYEPCKGLLTTSCQRSSMLQKISAGILSGGIATVLTNPLDVAKVRLQLGASGADYTPGRRQSPSMLMVLKEVARKEGVGALWRGVGPSMARAGALTASQCAVYDESKQMMKGAGLAQEGFVLHLWASMVAGAVSTATSAPFDTVKTRMMAQRQTLPSANVALKFTNDGNCKSLRTGHSDAAQIPKGSTPVYRGSLHCALVVLRTEGISGLYKGWGSNYARLGPQTAITFVAYEYLRKLLGMPSV